MIGPAYAARTDWTLPPLEVDDRLQVERERTSAPRRWARRRRASSRARGPLAGPSASNAQYVFVCAGVLAGGSRVVPAAAADPDRVGVGAEELADALESSVRRHAQGRVEDEVCVALVDRQVTVGGRGPVLAVLVDVVAVRPAVDPGRYVVQATVEDDLEAGGLEGGDLGGLAGNVGRGDLALLRLEVLPAEPDDLRRDAGRAFLGGALRLVADDAPTARLRGHGR